MIKTHTYPIIRRAGVIVAIAALAFSVTTTWLAGDARAAPPGRGAAATPPAPTPALPDDEAPLRMKKPVPRGKLNLNTASEEELQLLPGVGPAKAERIVAWRKKNGGFRRVADLRKVKGFGYKTLRKLEAYLDVKGTTTISAP
jgi:competence protein ComEA